MVCWRLGIIRFLVMLMIWVEVVWVKGEFCLVRKTFLWVLTVAL